MTGSISGEPEDGSGNAKLNFRDLMNQRVASSEQDAENDDTQAPEKGTSRANGVGTVYLMTGVDAPADERVKTDSDASGEDAETGQESKAKQSGATAQAAEDPDVNEDDAQAAMPALSISISPLLLAALGIPDSVQDSAQAESGSSGASGAGRSGAASGVSSRDTRKSSVAAASEQNLWSNDSTAAPVSTVEPVDSSQDAAADGSGRTGVSGDRVEWSGLVEEDEAGTAASSSQPVAFEARLSPNGGAADSPENTTPHPNSTNEDLSSTANSAASSTANAAPVKVQTAASDQGPDRAEPAGTSDTLVKADAVTTVSSGPMNPGAGEAQRSANPVQQPAHPSTVAAQMEPMIEAQKNPETGHSLTLNLPGNSPGAAGDASSVNLRFIERGGEVHVTVRTADDGLAQDLRSGLSDLSGRLAQAGFRTDVASPLTGEANTRQDSEPSSTDQRDAWGHQGRQGQEQQEQQNPRRPARLRWVQQLEKSTSQASQEQNA